MISDIVSLKNLLDLRYRNLVRIRWGIRDFKNQSKECLYPENVSRRESLFRQKYGLDHFFHKSRAATYKINLYFLDLLECFLCDQMDRFADRSIKVLDAGSDDWHYVSSLWSFLNYWSGRSGLSFQLKGIELDPYKMCKDLHTRLDYAEAHSRHLRNTQYQQGDVFDLDEKFEIAFAFLPFVTQKEAFGWKLPLRFYDPVKFFGRLYDCLEPGGLLLIVNVNEYESRIMQDILGRIEVKPVVPARRFTSPFFSYRTDRYVTLIEKG
jgi:hypothetical protein